MKMLKRLVFVFIFLASASIVKSQENKSLVIDSGIAYLNFKQGGSTANINYFSRAVDTTKSVKKIKIGRADIDTLNTLFATIKSKKHYQRKIGPSYYLKLYMGLSSYRIAMIPGYCLLDLDKKREYRLTHPKDDNFIRRFITRNNL